MLSKFTKFARDGSAAAAEIAGNTEFLLMTVEEKESYLKAKGALPNDIDIKIQSMPPYQSDEEDKRVGKENNYIYQADGKHVKDIIRPPTNYDNDNEILKPKDVISWISPFDGTGNVRVFIREVDDALSEMPNDKQAKCVLRMVIASKLLGPVKHLVDAQEFTKWNDIKSLLMSYYDVREENYTYLKEQRSRTVQEVGENVQLYARRFLEAHGSVLKAAGNRVEPEKARIALEFEEEEGIRSFTLGLTDRLNDRVETKNPKSVKEAINLALNAESQLQERYLTRRLAQLRIEERGRRRGEQRYREDHKPREIRQRDEYSRPRFERPRYRTEENPKPREYTATQTCHSCHKPGHRERDCLYKRNQDRQNFRPYREQDRPPPVRVVEEEQEEYDLDPFEYTQTELADRSCSYDQEEPTESYDS